MTLRRKMGLQITSMIVGLLLISGASLWGLNGLQQDYGAAVQGYEQLRQAYEVGSHLTAARTLLLQSPQPELPAKDQVQRALTKLEAVEPWPGEGAASYIAIRT